MKHEQKPTPAKNTKREYRIRVVSARRSGAHAYRSGRSAGSIIGVWPGVDGKLDRSRRRLSIGRLHHHARGSYVEPQATMRTFGADGLWQLCVPLSGRRDG